MSQTGSNGVGATGSGQIVNRAELRERRISIHIRGQDGTRLTFTIRHKLKLSVLFHNYCRRKQFDYRTARFFHEGLRVLGKYSAAQIPCVGKNEWYRKKQELELHRVKVGFL